MNGAFFKKYDLLYACRDEVLYSLQIISRTMRTKSPLSEKWEGEVFVIMLCIFDEMHCKFEIARVQNAIPLLRNVYKIAMY